MSTHEFQSFSHATESQITRLLVSEFADWFQDCIETDVLIAGGGPSGLICARELARKGVKVVLVERNNYLGGGFWTGGFLMNKVIVRSPGDGVLAELGVPFKEVAPGVVAADGPHACSRLIAAACEAGVRILNMTSVEDVVIREDSRVAGLVINWTPVYSLPREVACIDPVALEARAVVDATGHDAAVVRHLANRGLASVPGCHPMWVEKSEDEVVRRTGFVHPGLMVIGMSVAAVYGLPRMGPSFGAMFLSGVRGAELLLQYLGK
ncbi:MAG: sulfide-dependent adenosine diphosphate thiazole synthase [Armatimonadota bacterium]|nr:sulfide-dependent adenosine diphosphate thiazole synthase [Armatimonadota bacterium]